MRKNNSHRPRDLHFLRLAPSAQSPLPEARYLVLDMKEMDVWRMVGLSASVLVLALAVLVIRYGHVRFPCGRGEEEK